MKKIILFALTVFSASVMAQHVTPLNIQIASANLDSLRSLYVTEPPMWYASLDVVAQQLNKNAEELKQAKTEFKAEQAHAKEMKTSLVQAAQLAKSLKSLYSKEEDELKSMQKVVEKQQRNLSKQKDLNQETRDNYHRLLDKQQKELGYSLREVAERLRAVSDLETTIQNGKSGLQVYEMELNMKANQLSQLEATYKSRLEAVKAEKKTAKSMK